METRYFFIYNELLKTIAAEKVNYKTEVLLDDKMIPYDHTIHTIMMLHNQWKSLCCQDTLCGGFLSSISYTYFRYNHPIGFHFPQLSKQVARQLHESCRRQHGPQDAVLKQQGKAAGQDEYRGNHTSMKENATTHYGALTDVVEKSPSYYKGGNKQYLSTAVAIILF